jgi:hypothetical protein
MEAGSWFVFALAATAALILAYWFYRRRETPGRGRTLLSILRGAAIAVLLLLILDPKLPGAVRANGEAVLLDGSLSMRMPSGDSGTTRWSQAAARARALSSGPVIVFGDAAHQVAPDSLASIEPAATRSQLLPALQAVAEAGRTRATVVTDGGLSDADEVMRWLSRLGVELKVEPIGTPVTNRGIVRVTAPGWVETGRPIDIHFEIAATGASGGPVVVQARQGDQVLTEMAVAAPAEGRVSAGTLRFNAAAPADDELARYDIVIQSDDVIEDDDVRSVYVRVSAEPQGAVLLSFQPDWEPRFLQPVLERSLGMPVRGYLRMSDHWRSVGTGMSVGERAADEEVRRMVGRAELLIVHAYTNRLPGWVREAAGTAPRLMVFPAGDGEVPGVSLEPTGAVAADWYLSDVIPPSPIAPLLAGIDVRDVPPLSALRIPGRVAGSWAPLTVSRGRRGLSYPVALGGTAGGKRWIITLGEGYWRWAFWSDHGRDVYERLFSALAGWLVEEQVANGPDAIGPAERVVPRGERVRWVSGGLQPDSTRIRVSRENDVVMDTLIQRSGSDTLSTPSLAPGHYQYRMTAYVGAERAQGEGALTIESFSEEFTRPSVAAASLESAPAALGDAGSARTPIHATLWPYALLILLLSAEWILRRRWGLR